LHAGYVHKALQLIYWGADDIEDIYLKIRPLAKRVMIDRDVKSQLMTLMVGSPNLRFVLRLIGHAYCL
jgi:hypothetical protein